MIRLPHVLQVSSCLDILYTYITDVTEWNQVQSGLFCAVFDPSRQGGQNPKNRDCLRWQCGADPPTGPHILVCSGKRIMLFPYCLVYIFHLRRIGCIPRLPKLPCNVHLITHSMVAFVHYPIPASISPKLPAFQGAPLWNCLPMVNKSASRSSPLSFPHVRGFTFSRCTHCPWALHHLAHLL